MCGIVGIAGFTCAATQDKMFKDLLHLDTIRGPDSTGILCVATNDKTQVLKNIGTPWDVLETSAGDKLFKTAAKLWLGHNRWATRGRVNRLNAHPFEFDNIIGVHNGTLTRQNLLPDYEYYEVDSENIFASMNEYGVKETISNLDGAYTLVWYNKKEKTINFIRNALRPLFYVLTEDNKYMMWASEVWMLHAASVRNRVKIGTVREVAIDTHYKFSLPKKHKSNFPQPERTKMEGHTYPSWVDTWMGGRGQGAGNTNEKKKVGHGTLALVGGTGNTHGMYDTTKNQEWRGVVLGWVDVPAKDGKIMHIVLEKYKSKTNAKADKKGNTGSAKTLLERKAEARKNVEDTLDLMQIDGYGVDRLTFREFKFLTAQICAVCAGDIEFLDKNLFWADTAFCVCSECMEQTKDGQQFVEFAEINRWNGYANVK